MVFSDEDKETKICRLSTYELITEFPELRKKLCETGSTDQ